MVSVACRAKSAVNGQFSTSWFNPVANGSGVALLHENTISQMLDCFRDAAVAGRNAA